jgi:hypothetical protein
VTLAGEVGPLLDRFRADVGGVLPLAALWAHGSLALGDFQPGRSDLDLVALTGAALTREQEQELRRMHEALQSQVSLAEKLHCAYVVRSEVGDTGRSHLTWAHGELLDRVVSPVSRRELHQGGLCLLGPGPSVVIPAVTDQELADYIRSDLRDYWYPKTGRADLWLHDIWVDLGLLTFARAAVTLREGRLITKREALDVLASLGAPADVVRDIYQRRYQSPPPITERWRTERGHQARTYLREGIRQVSRLSESGSWTARCSFGVLRLLRIVASGKIAPWCTACLWACGTRCALAVDRLLGSRGLGCERSRSSCHRRCATPMTAAGWCNVVDEYLQHLRLGRDAAESTTKSYAEALALCLRWCEETSRDWRGRRAPGRFR